MIRKLRDSMTKRRRYLNLGFGASGDNVIRVNAGNRTKWKFLALP